MNPRSLAKLATCHADLQRLMIACDAKQAVEICQGERSAAEEIAAKASGKSHTARSRHVRYPDLPPAWKATAVDWLPTGVGWEDKQGFCDYYYNVIQPTAAELEIDVRWGGAWTGPRNNPVLVADGRILDDLDHVELKGA
jgi:hypothetical protein